MQISAKDLGWLKTDSFCPRCFWIERHDRHLPYQTPFAGIFSSIDSYTKNVVERYFEKNRRFPSWLNGIGNPKKLVKIQSKEFRITKGDIIFTGIPDELFKTDTGYGILDYKTAKYSGTQDSLMPVYEVQLNGYAYIAESLGMKPVETLHLVYFEPPYKETFEHIIEKHTNANGFEMPFKPKIHGIRKDTGEVERLLDKANRIYSMGSPPEGLKGCEDCKRLDELIKLVGN